MWNPYTVLWSWMAYFKPSLFDKCSEDNEGRGVNSPPILLPGPPFNVPIRRTRVYPAFDHFLKYRGGRQRHPIQHHCSAAVTNGVVSKQTPFPQFPNQIYQIHGRLRSSTLHWQRFVNRSKNLDPGGVLNWEPKDCEADTLTAELSLSWAKPKIHKSDGAFEKEVVYGTLVNEESRSGRKKTNSNLSCLVNRKIGRRLNVDGLNQNVWKLIEGDICLYITRTRFF